MENHKFGRWSVVGFAYRDNASQVYLSCVCDCGTTKVVHRGSLRSGKTKSCGCIRDEAIFKHGKCGSREYRSWDHMMQRCKNKNNSRFDHYGGRGITVCKRWEESINFIDDMGPCPEGYQLDRIDNNKGYSPKNCQWVTMTENMRNQRKSKYWFVDGVRFDSLGHASQVLGIARQTIRHWCSGGNVGGYYYGPKEGCWDEKKYAEGAK